MTARTIPRDRAPAASDWPADYAEQFWCAYPRRIAKKAAMRALERARRSNEVAFTELMAAVERYASAVAMKDIQFVAHAATWLNGGRWEDDPGHLEGSYHAIRKIGSAKSWASERRGRLGGQAGGDPPRLAASNSRGSD